MKEKIKLLVKIIVGQSLYRLFCILPIQNKVVFSSFSGKRYDDNPKAISKKLYELYPDIKQVWLHHKGYDKFDIEYANVVEWPSLKVIYECKFRLDKIKRIVPGGKTGQMSIYNGLLAAKEISGNSETIVLIHDGVRPLISSDLLTRNIEDVNKYGTSITSGIVKETIVEIDDSGNIKLVPDREHSRVAKAPQCFYLKDILSAHKQAQKEGVTTFIDSCTMMKHYP